MGYVPQAHQPFRKPTLPTIEDRLDKITELRSAAQEAMRRDQDRIIKDRRHKPYEVDDQVWLEGTNLKMPYEMAKLSPKRYGPFRVAAKISNTSYQLDLPPTWKIHPVFHATLLTPYRETEAYGPNFLEPPPDIIEGEPEWEVEKILAERRYRNRRQYLIRWKNYSPAHDSWTNENDIHADELISQYRKNNQPTEPRNRGRTRTKAYIRATHEAEETPLPPSEPTTPAFSTPPFASGRSTPTYTEYNEPYRTFRQRRTLEDRTTSPTKRPTQIEDDLATSLKRKRAIERLRLTLLPVINEPGPPPVLAIDIDIPDDFRAPTPKAEVIQTPIDNDITDKDYQSPVDSRFLTLPPAKEIAPRSYRPLPR